MMITGYIGDFIPPDPIFEEKIETSSKTKVPPLKNEGIQNGHLWGKI